MMASPFAQVEVPLTRQSGLIICHSLGIMNTVIDHGLLNHTIREAYGRTYLPETPQKLMAIREHLLFHFAYGEEFS